MTFVKKGVVIPLGSAGEVDSAYADSPSVLKTNNKFYCYYTAYNGFNARTALAISEDGVNFIKKGVVIPLGSPGEADDTHAYAPFVLKTNNKFYCYYNAHDGFNIRTALAISKDGVNFIKKGVVIPLGSSGEADDTLAYDSFVLKTNNKFYCYYTAHNGSTYRIALAISKDGVNFIKKGVVIPSGSPGEADDAYAYAPFVLKTNNKFYCYYNAYDETNARTALAISEDGVNFIKKGVVIPLGSSGEVDDIHAYFPSVIHINDKFYCYYTAYNGSTFYAALAISKDGM